LTAAIIRVANDDPAFFELFVAHLLVRTIGVEADLIDQLFNSRNMSRPSLCAMDAGRRTSIT